MKTNTEATATLTLITSRPPSLDAAQAQVGGMVEVVYLRDGRQMLVNEEGLLMRLPFNAEATNLAGRPIVGNAVVLSGKALWT